MKKITLIVIIMIFSSIACNNKNNEGDKVKNKNDIKEYDNNKKVKSGVNEEIHKNMLQGIWAENKDANASFTIEGNKVLYFEDDDTSFHYLFKNNIFTLMADQDTITSYKVVKLTQDSLIMIAQEGNIIRLTKIKE